MGDGALDPFDQAVLQRELGLRGWRFEAYLFNDHHTLAMLARRRGIDVDALADRLVAPWRGRVTLNRLATLRERTMRLLTQGHLAQHVFFHVFHRLGLRPVSRRLFGVSSALLDVLRRLRHLTPLQIARRYGGAPKHAIVAELRKLVRKRRDRGVWSTRLGRRRLTGCSPVSAERCRAGCAVIPRHWIPATRTARRAFSIPCISADGPLQRRSAPPTSASRKRCANGSSTGAGRRSGDGGGRPASPPAASRPHRGPAALGDRRQRAGAAALLNLLQTKRRVAGGGERIGWRTANDGPRLSKGP